jgi:NitT/TauT family transport system permease protein
VFSPLLALIASLASVGRVFATIAVAIVSGWLLAYLSTRSRVFENIFIPAIEILESVPVITFFPVALIFFIENLGGYAGVEAAALFLVFTATAWNIWLGIYQAFKTVPGNMVEAMDNYMLSFSQRMARLYIPYSIPRISSELIPSFTNGLFYITVSEVFSIGSTDYRVFGIGSLIYDLSSSGHYIEALYSLAFLAMIVSLIVIGLRRFSEYAIEKYGLETESRIHYARRGVIRGAGLSRLSRAVTPIARISRYVARGGIHLPSIENRARLSAIWKISKYVMVIATFSILIYIAVIKIEGIEPSLWGYLFSRIDRDLASIAIDYARIAIISLAALTMAIFLGYYVATKPGMEGIFIPASQVIAAIPAPAYFPLLYGITHRYIEILLGPLSSEFYVLLLGFISTYYYIFYTYWLGVKNMPAQFWDIMDNLSLGFWDKLRMVVLPSTFPYIVAGMTATINGAWGGLAIGEHWPNIYDGRSLEVSQGLMRELALASDRGDLVLLTWLSLLFSISVAIYAILITRRLMDLAGKRYIAEEAVFAA